MKRTYSGFIWVMSSFGPNSSHVHMKYINLNQTHEQKHMTLI